MLKKKDFVLLTLLRANARQSISELARKTKMPVSTVFDRIRKHGNSYIQKHVTMLNFPMLGFNARAHIMLKARDKDELLTHLLKNPNVNTIYKINNGFDFIIECIFQGITELENFIENLEVRSLIKNKDVHYIIEDVKKEAFLSDVNLLDILVKNTK